MSIQIDVKPRLETLSRLRVLYHVVHELSRGFGLEEYRLENIRKGILERQILGEIFINYLNAEEKLVGKITITIDWEKHRVLAKSGEGKNFEIDPTKSINEQISRIYPLLVAHTEELRKAFDVKRIGIQYQYKRDMWGDEKKLKEAREFLGTSVATEELKWAEISTSSSTHVKEWDVEFEYISRKLAELSIKIEHNKPK